jgi:hypothetical protein
LNRPNESSAVTVVITRLARKGEGEDIKKEKEREKKEGKSNFFLSFPRLFELVYCPVLL